MSQINNKNNHGINRGIELMLRRRKPEKESKKYNTIIEIKKQIKIFRKEFLILFQLSKLSKK